MLCIYTMGYYSATQGNEVLTGDTTWMKLENIILKNETGHKRTYIAKFHLCEISRIDQFVDTESVLVVA